MEGTFEDGGLGVGLESGELGNVGREEGEGREERKKERREKVGRIPDSWGTTFRTYSVGVSKGCSTLIENLVRLGGGRW